MKLKKVTSNDKVVRTTLSFKQSSVIKVDEYRAYYKSIHGDDISSSLLIEEMIKEFISKDKDFDKYLEEQKANTSQKAS